MVVSFRYALDCCVLTAWCQLLVGDCCVFISPDRDHCKLGKLMTVISLFTVYGIMEASCMFYLIAPSVMKLGFCIMVSLQVLLVNIMKRHEIGQVLKVCSIWKKDLCICFIWKIVNYGQWLIFYSDI
jgi:hypothetical protein